MYSVFWAKGAPRGGVSVCGSIGKSLSFLLFYTLVSWRAGTRAFTTLAWAHGTPAGRGQSGGTLSAPTVVSVFLDHLGSAHLFLDTLAPDAAACQTFFSSGVGTLN